MTMHIQDEQAISERDGHIRAIEAILLELVDANTIRAAKERLRKTWKNERRNRRWADISDCLNRPYDHDAEAALDALINKAESKHS
jgi:hypothetical protein